MHPDEDPNKFCCWCGADVAPLRWQIGYRTCKVCDEEEARADLKGLNNKGGLVK